MSDMTAGVSYSSPGFTDRRFTATILRGGGRDARGNVLPTVEIPLTQCLYGPRATEDPVDRSDLTETRAVLYSREPGAVVEDTDRLVLPGRGTWAVDGDPKVWSPGLEVPIRKEGST